MVKLEEPDKGQAWVIAICACIINTVLSGLSRMIGLLYVAVIDTYGVSRQEATLPFTVRNSIRMLSGPLVGIVGQRYGIRAVTFWGGVVASIGAALCCVAPSIVWLSVFWGGIHGFGFAFANTLFQVVVNQYFQKYRATASGIALSGACVGSFVFPVMIEEILEAFQLSGGFLILAGIVMHVLPPALLLKSPMWVTDPERYARLKALYMKQNSTEAAAESEMPGTPAEEAEPIREWRQFVRSSSMTNNPVEEVEICSESLKSCPENLSTCFHNITSVQGTKHCKRNVVCTLYKINESPKSDRQCSCANGNEVSEDKTVHTQISEDKSVHTQIPTVTADLEARNNELNAPNVSEKAPSTPPNQTSFKDSLRGIAFLYTNPAYVLINIGITTYLVIFIPLLTVIVDYGKDKGISELYGKYLINAMAFGDLIGRLGFGWITDRGIIPIPIFITLAFIFQGISIALFPFAMSLYTFSLLLVLYGLTAGAVLTHFPLLVLRYVDSSLQAVAMGCVGFMSGIITFAIPPMIGHFRDNIGSYDGMFYLTGGLSIVSGSIWLFEPLMGRIHHRTQDKKEALRNEKLKQIEQSKSLEIITSSNGNKQS